MIGRPEAPLKLYDFPGRDRGEAARLILHYANAQFEDIRLSPEQWVRMKPKMPHGTLPVLQVDGRKLSNGVAIAAFLARRFELAGRSDWEYARIDEAVQTYRDCYGAVAPSLAQFVTDHNAAADVEAAIQPYLPLFSRMLQQQGANKFIAAPRVTFADFLIGDYLHTIHEIVPEAFEGFGELVDYMRRVLSLPQILYYVRMRPKSLI